ncbi:MAG: hypothetical protein Q8S19_10475, partial [Bacillota bacterium]|nr:hypothetical protein [Bacillota bacterium]
DNAIGIVDIRRGRVERYIKLRAPNPGALAYEEGKLFVINGIMYGNGNLIGEIIEPLNNFVSTPIELLGVVFGSSLAVRNGKAYLSTLVGKANDRAFFSFDLKTKEITKIFDDIYFTSVVFDNEGRGYGLIPKGRYIGIEVGIDQVIVFDPDKKEMLKTIELKEQSSRAHRLFFSDNKLYITFFEDSRGGETIGILDLETEDMRTINGFRGPYCVISINGKIYVANHNDKTIDLVDENTGEKLSTVKVGLWPWALIYIKGNGGQP